MLLSFCVTVDVVVDVVVVVDVDVDDCICFSILLLVTWHRGLISNQAIWAI